MSEALDWVKNIGGSKKKNLVIKTNNISIQYFKKSKFIQKIHDEQHIKNFNKDEMSYSAAQSHVGAWGKSND